MSNRIIRITCPQNASEADLQQVAAAVADLLAAFPGSFVRHTSSPDEIVFEVVLP